MQVPKYMIPTRNHAYPMPIRTPMNHLQTRRPILLIVFWKVTAHTRGPWESPWVTYRSPNRPTLGCFGHVPLTTKAAVFVGSYHKALYTEFGKPSRKCAFGSYSPKASKYKVYLSNTITTASYMETLHDAYISLGIQMAQSR